MSPLLSRILGTIGLVLYSPLIGLVALAIWLVDGAPILFCQMRLGQELKPFRVIKFRTLSTDGSPTRTGRWLRNTGLDELPQILHIARGEMMAVGPRPLTKTDRARFGYSSPEHLVRWSAKPGLTGLAQIVGGRTAKHSWRLDRLYLKRRSTMLDLRIIAVTLLMNVVGRKAIRRWGFI